MYQAEHFFLVASGRVDLQRGALKPRHWNNISGPADRRYPDNPMGRSSSSLSSHYNISMLTEILSSLDNSSDVAGPAVVL